MSASNFVHDSFKAKCLQATSYDLLTTDIYARLLVAEELPNYRTITNATNSTPIVITTSTPHGMSTDQRYTIRGVSGNTATNGRFNITVLSTTTFSLQDAIDSSDVAGNGTYSAGGECYSVETVDYLNALPAEATWGGDDVILTGKTVQNGIFDADDIKFINVPNGTVVKGVILYYSLGSRFIIAVIDTLDSNPFSVQANGSDIDIFWSNGIHKIFRL